MSVLTKVLVVLVTVLSVVLVALVVPFVANQEQYKSKYEQERAQRSAAEASARVAESRATAAEENDNELVARYQAEANAKTTQINLLQTQLAQARGENESRIGELAQTKADQSRLAAANDQLSKMLDAMRGELTERRDKMVELELKLVEATDQVNELTSQFQTASVSIRRLREDLAAREETLRDYENRITKLPQDIRDQMMAKTSAAAPYVPEVAIHGQVQKIEAVAGETFAQLNIGKKDQVAENMKFIVYRGDQFLGTLVITLVDEDSSVGRVVLQQGAIANGDAVRTGGL
ncbi:MAG: hypothetical protein IT443_03790 [Phycisphaeraceae bacterium]|nr:hypothetical protein [Phycisphaeraceae bacterium]